MIRKDVVCWALSAAFFLLVGCQEQQRRLAIEGKVTLQGQPIKHGRIEFVNAEEGKPAGAVAGGLVSDGKYRLTPVHGLEPGKYKVLISCTQEIRVPPPGWQASSLPTEELLPPEFSAYEHLSHVVEVSHPGPNVFNFAIP